MFDLLLQATLIFLAVRFLLLHGYRRNSTGSVAFCVLSKPKAEARLDVTKRAVLGKIWTLFVN